MSFDWKPLEGYAYNLARQCDTEFGRIIIKPTRPNARKFVVKIGGETISRYEASVSSAMLRAEAHINKLRNQNR